MELPEVRAEARVCRGRSLKCPQRWKGVHYVVLRRDVLTLWIDCLGLELGWNSHGCDSEFLDPACEWDCIIDDPLGDGTHRPNVLTDQAHHGDS